MKTAKLWAYLQAEATQCPRKVTLVRVWHRQAGRVRGIDVNLDTKVLVPCTVENDAHIDWFINLESNNDFRGDDIAWEPDVLSGQVIVP